MAGRTALAAIGTWSGKTPTLHTAASWYGQHDGPVILDDTGTVLVAGGADAASAPVPQVAVHHPADGGWESKPDLRTARKLHTVTALDDGTVLVTGGLTGTAATGAGTAACERSTAAVDAWHPTGAMGTHRWGHSAVRLNDGTVMVAGGSTVRAGQTMKALRSVERYDPESGEWTALPDMTDARTGHTAVVLAEGRVLVCGGTAPVGTATDPGVAFCEVYDPQENRWTPTGSLLRARRHHRAVRVDEHSVLITGGTAAGANGEGPFDPFADHTAELFDLGSGSWSAVADLPSGRGFHRSVRWGSGQVLVVGGAASDRDEAGYRSAVVLDVKKNVWTPVAGMATGRWSFAAAELPDTTDTHEHRVLVVGGVTRSGLAAADPGVTELTVDTEVFTGGSV